MARQVSKLVADCFKNSADPWGRPWLKPKHRAGKPLEDTGRLKGSIHYDSSGNRVLAFSNVAYAAIHNYGGPIKKKASFRYAHESGRFMSTRDAMRLSKRGTGYVLTTQIGAHVFQMPKRQFLPDGDLPPAWASSLSAVATDTMKRLTGGK